MYNFAHMWKTIEAHIGYEISEYGEVRNKRGKILKGQISKLGYQYYYLDKKWRLAHRLVASIYLSAPLDKREVNHIDGNKLNNHYSNLEWVTHAENIQKSFDSGQRVPRTGKYHWNAGKKYNDSTKKIMSDKKKGVNHPKFVGWYKFEDKLFTSLNEASASTGVDSRNIARSSKAGANGWSFISK